MRVDPCGIVLSMLLFIKTNYLIDLKIIILKYYSCARALKILPDSFTIFFLYFKFLVYHFCVDYIRNRCRDLGIALPSVTLMECTPRKPIQMFCFESLFYMEYNVLFYYIEILRE